MLYLCIIPFFFNAVGNLFTNSKWRVLNFWVCVFLTLNKVTVETFVEYLFMKFVLKVIVVALTLAAKKFGHECSVARSEGRFLARNKEDDALHSRERFRVRRNMAYPGGMRLMPISLQFDLVSFLSSVIATTVSIAFVSGLTSRGCGVLHSA